MNIELKLILILAVGLIHGAVVKAQFPAYSTVDDLTTEQAFAIHGTADSGAYGSGASSIGDFNADGLDDIIISARTSDPNGNASGTCFVIFGNDGLMPVDFDVSKLDGQNGFALNGVSEMDLTGISVGSAGDVNNDGIADLLIGARGVNFSSGAVYVVYGTTSLMPATLELSDLDGNNGFTIMGEATSDWLGSDVAGVGDVNNDQIDDVMIGAMTADNNGSSSGAVYVVFGRSNFPASIDVEDLDGSDGFMFNAVAAGDRLNAVSSAGDFNNDGINDMIMGAYYADPGGINLAGEAYLVFGQDTVGTSINFPATFELASIDSSTGIVFPGLNENDTLGAQLANAGDINHDGVDDIALSATFEDSNDTNSGSVYVIYGTTDAITSPFDLSTLNGDNGFVMHGENQDDYAGSEIAFGGDFNDDGNDDFIIGVGEADSPNTNEGLVYFLYGSDIPFPAAFDLDNIDNDNGFILAGNDNWDKAGNAVDNAGDFNGDGISDLLVSVSGNDFNGESNGTVYILFGSSDVIFKSSFEQ